MKNIPIFLLLAMVLTACAPKAAPTADPTALAQSISLRVTELAAQTLAAYKSPIPSLSPIPSNTPAPIVTPSPTVYTVDFTGNEIFVAFLAEGQSQVSIIVPNGIQGDYTAKINDKEFSCFSYVMKTIPRLICVGPSLARGTIMKIVVYPKNSKVSIFEKQFTTPY
ncbi:MAG: hypothetical protein AB9891_08880 [Anaerolineaceae bacterium]